MSITAPFLWVSVSVCGPPLIPCEDRAASLSSRAWVPTMAYKSKPLDPCLVDFINEVIDVDLNTSETRMTGR